uniref:ATP-dependent DNA ligase n=1 Tax=uncultured Mycolicibacterium sp. TaxID=2320817 RepID=UPI0032B12F58
TRHGNPLGADSTRPTSPIAGSSARRSHSIGRLAEVQSTRRGIAVLDGDDATLLSRNGMNITATFPEIASALPKALGHRRVVLDGEIVALDADGVPCFSRLQRRWPQSRRPTPELLREVPVRFYAFDLLHLEGLDTKAMPYIERRSLLADLAESARGRVIQVPPHWSGVDPDVVLATSADLGLEGIVCKRLDSLYTPGLRSRDWVKTCHRQRGEFIIGGWLPGAGVNRNTVGALLVGAHDECGRLVFCGSVGAGLSAAHRRMLIKLLTPLASHTSPFENSVPSLMARHARWVSAELIGDVEYRQLAGLLRHPSWKGLRHDLADVCGVVLPRGVRAA